VPWRIGDLLALWVPLVAGGVMLIMAWWGSSSTAKLSDQVFWLDVGVAGVIVAGVGIVLWLITGRRAIGERRKRLMPDVLVISTVASGGDVTSFSDELVTAARMTRYHRADCPLVTGKTIRKATGSSARSAGLEPCGVCNPDQAAAG
jgi:hypothetical protein